MDPTERLIEQLVDFVFDCGPDRIPQDVRETAALFLLDSIGIAIGNREKAFVQRLFRATTRTVAKGEATAIGFPARLAAEGAAMVNSAAIHGNDFDATHLESIMHPCAVLVPTVLAVAEEVEAGGAQVVSAIVAGTEVLIRMGLATRGAMHRAGFQSTALCAPVVLAMVASKLYGLPREQAADAAGLAASIGAGLRAFSNDGTWGKRIITGWSCRAGLAAANLAAEGYPGSHDALEKRPYGLYQAFVPASGYDLGELTKGLGEEWHTRAVELKRYPSSHGLHAFIDSALRARGKLNGAAETIRSVACHVSDEARKWWFEPKERKYQIGDVYASRFSIPFAVALALVFGEVTDAHFESRRFLDDPRVLALVPRVVPKIDPALSNENPNVLPGTLEIATDTGSRTFVGRGSLSERTLRDDVLEKFDSNVRSAWNPDKGQEIVATAMDIERAQDVAGLMALLR